MSLTRPAALRMSSISCVAVTTAVRALVMSSAGTGLSAVTRNLDTASAGKPSCPSSPSASRRCGPVAASMRPLSSSRAASSCRVTLALSLNVPAASVRSSVASSCRISATSPVSAAGRAACILLYCLRKRSFSALRWSRPAFISLSAATLAAPDGLPAY